MASLKEELKKIIIEQLKEITVPAALLERITKNLDRYDEAQLIQLLDVLHLQNNPSLLEPLKETQLKKMAYLKKRLIKAIKRIRKIKT